MRAQGGQRLKTGIIGQVCSADQLQQGKDLVRQTGMNPDIAVGTWQGSQVGKTQVKLTTGTLAHEPGVRERHKIVQGGSDQGFLNRHLDVLHRVEGGPVADRLQGTDGRVQAGHILAKGSARWTGGRSSSPIG